VWYVYNVNITQQETLGHSQKQILKVDLTRTQNVGNMNTQADQPLVLEENENERSI